MTRPAPLPGVQCGSLAPTHTKETHINITQAQPALNDAKFAVRIFWTHQHCLPDTSMVCEAIDAIREARDRARATSTPWTEKTWRSLAELVDEACDDDGLPRLYRTGELSDY